VRTVITVLPGFLNPDFFGVGRGCYEYIYKYSKIQSECKIRNVKVRCKSYQVKFRHFPGKLLKMADSLQKLKVPTSDGAAAP
jgi:hypothetical protein